MDKTKGPLYQYLYKVEQKFYRSIKPVDILFNLQAPLEVAIERNDMRDKLGKESTEELRERFSINSGVSFLSDKTIDIDATKSIENVFAMLKKNVYGKINKTYKKLETNVKKAIQFLTKYNFIKLYNHGFFS